MLPFANFINGSSTLNVAVLTVTVSPFTVKSPALVTSSGNPTVNVAPSPALPDTSI